MSALTPEQHRAALGVVTIGRHLGSPDADTRDVLAALGLAPMRKVSRPLACGHTTADLRRDVKGFRCSRCRAATQAASRVRKSLTLGGAA